MLLCFVKIFAPVDRAHRVTSRNDLFQDFRTLFLINICDQAGNKGSKVSGFVHSPNYPGIYGDKISCTMRLSVRPGQQLVVFVVSGSRWSGTAPLPSWSRTSWKFLEVGSWPRLNGLILNPIVVFNSSIEHDSSVTCSRQEVRWASSCTTQIILVVCLILAVIGLIGFINYSSAGFVI
jgi:hypothetical protein